MCRPLGPASLDIVQGKEGQKMHLRRGKAAEKSHINSRFIRSFAMASNVGTGKEQAGQPDP